MVYEWCQHCDKEVFLLNIKYAEQNCPNCHKLIKACSLCEDTEYCNICDREEFNE